MFKIKMYQAILLTSILFNSYPIKSARILGIFPMLCKSHSFIHQPIIEGLVGNGHEVTVISHFKSENASLNYTEILLPDGFINWVDSIAIADSIHNIGVRLLMKNVLASELITCNKVLGIDYIKKLINSKTKSVDLIIAEPFAKKCFHLLAYKIKAPMIILFPISVGIGVDYFIGNPNNPSITPVFFSKFTTKMNFWQRFQNFLQYAVMIWYENYVLNRNLERDAREFEMDLPTDEELNKMVALTFYNNHPSFMARPKSPNVIDIAGIHIKEPKKLPEDVEDFIEGSDHGVILFSFGTTIKTSSICLEKLKVILDAFSVLPQKILWRVNELNITEVPPNVKIVKWFPQRDILVERGVGIFVDYFSMDKKTLTDAINEVTTNSKYRENMHRLSRIFRDRPIAPLDEALYWSEYVLKHKGAPHLRPVAADMPLYQYVLLDLILFVLGIFISLFFISKIAFKLVISRFCLRKLNKNKIQ